MTANQVDKALSAGVSQTASQLLTIPEDQWFDRKSIRSHPSDMAKHLVAFANAEGGVLVVGLHSGKVEGARANIQRVNDYQQAAMDFTVPPVRSRVEQVGCVREDGALDSLIVVRVDPGETVHELKNGECYLRVGDESRKLGHDQRRELEFDRGQGQYDGQVISGYGVEDLNPDHLTFYREANQASTSTTRLLKARSLINREGQLTNAGLLLFGDHPQEVFPQAYIRIIKYLSTDRGTGSRLSVEDDHDYKIEGAIPQAIAEAATKIDSLVPRRRALRHSGLFETAPIVPRDAWLEGLVNAVVHRSYSLGGDHIRVEIFPDRIEVQSPGRFPGLADPARPLDISRFARNPRIARVCADLAIGQELGEGIKRIFDEMRRVGLTDPVYRQNLGSVTLVLQAVPQLDRATAERLPSNAQRVLDVLRANSGDLGTGDIADLIGMSRPATKSRLDALEKEGLVLWIGKSVRDPRAVWRLAT